jgi:glycosyl transferase family 25
MVVTNQIVSRNEPSAASLGGLSVHYINLDRSVERRTALENHLSQIGLLAHRFPAVDGKTIPPQHVKSAQHRFWPFVTIGRRLESPEVACALSHLGLARQLAAAKTDLALVLEDDARIDIKKLREVVAALDRMPRDWDVLILNCIQNHFPYVIGPLGENHTLFGILGEIDSAAGYLIRYSGLQKLSRIEMLETTADRWTWFAIRQNLRVYGVWPMPITTEQLGPSDIDQQMDRTKKTNFFQRKVVKALRRSVIKVLLRSRAYADCGSWRPAPYAVARIMHRGAL